ncbi:hypothetical protein AB4139_12460 [Vibrio cyclitrophicus]
MINKALNVILTSVIQKSLPILMGVFVMNYYGNLAFTQFSLFLTAIASIVVFVSTGMTPALIKSAAKFRYISEQRRVFEEFLITSLILWIFVSVTFLSAGYFHFLPELFDNITYQFLIVSMCMIVILFSLSLMQTLGLTSTSLKVSIGNALMLIVSCGVASFIDFYFFLNLYTVTFVLMAVNCLINLARNDLFIFHKLCITNPFNLVCDTVKQSGSVFIPNIIWMLSVFYFHVYVSSNTHTTSLYSSFAIGYQWLTFIVFIPGALAPLVISYFSKEGLGFKKAYLLSITYLILGIFLCVIFYQFSGYFSLLYGYEFSEKEIDIVLFVLLSGAIAGANAPLIQFLIGISKAYYICVASLLWSIVSIIPQVSLNLFLDFYEVFFIAYLVSYLSLLVISYKVSFSD